MDLVIPHDRIRCQPDVVVPKSTDRPPPPERNQRTLARVRELAQAGPESEEPLRRMVVQSAASVDAETVCAMIAQQFPGRLWVYLDRPHRPLRTARRLCALASTLVDVSACAPEAVRNSVIELMNSPIAAARLAAAFVAGDLRDEAFILPLLERLGDSNALVRTAALTALSSHGEFEELQEVRARWHSTLSDHARDAREQAAAAAGLGQLRDSQAVPLLISRIGVEGVDSVARRALRRITARDHGDSKARWKWWLTRRGGHKRIQWLTSSLDQPDLRCRQIALQELTLLTGEGFNRRAAIATLEQARELQQEFDQRFADPDRVDVDWLLPPASTFNLGK